MDDDPPAIAVNWKPAFVAANLDLGPACVTAAPATVGPSNP
jgi:hypothetical protein